MRHFGGVAYEVAPRKGPVVSLQRGDVFVFQKILDPRMQLGTVLEVDLCASYPLKVEYVLHNGDKRIETFAANEFRIARKADHAA